MSSICRLSAAEISAGGGTTGPVWDWVRISIVRLAGAGSKPFGGYANETRHPSPLFGNRPCPAILRHPGQDRQLPGHRQLPLRRADDRLAGRHPALLARTLGQPEHWANDANRRKKVKVPEDVAFRTKPPIALDLLDRAKAWGVRWACVTADADYGDNPNFLDGLEKRRRPYVVAVRADFAVSVSRRGGEVRRADVLVGDQAAWSGRSVTWREGSRGWMRGKFVALRAWRVTSLGRRRAGWLIGEDASDGKRRYYWSNFGPDVTLQRLVEYAHRRHWVEQYHEEAKGLLGWDQYPGRLWSGFHRHAVSVMLAYSFLVWQEWQQRQERVRPGRPRRAFSPSAGSTSGVAARDPSTDLRLAPPRGGQGRAVA